MKYNLYKDSRSLWKQLWCKTRFFLLKLKEPLCKYNRNLTVLSITYPVPERPWKINRLFFVNWRHAPPAPHTHTTRGEWLSRHCDLLFPKGHVGIWRHTARNASVWENKQRNRRRDWGGGLGKKLCQKGSCSREAHCLGEYIDNFWNWDTHLTNLNRFLSVMQGSV